MKFTRAVLFGLTFAAVTAAHAQYQWIDKDGRRVFSDRPPPADVPQKNVLKQPRMSNAPLITTAPAAPAAAASTPAAGEAPNAATRPAAAASAAPAGVDKALEEKKKQAEAAEAAKNEAEQEKVAAAFENLEFAIRYKTMKEATVEERDDRIFVSHHDQCRCLQEGQGRCARPAEHRE